MRSRSVATTLALVAMTTQVGSFGLTKEVYSFNDSVSDAMIVKEALFFAMGIVPVYGLAALGDAIIFSLIELLTGANPIADACMIEADGRSAAFERHAKGAGVVGMSISSWPGPSPVEGRRWWQGCSRPSARWSPSAETMGARASEG